MPLQILDAQEKPFRHKGKTVKEWLSETKGGTKAARISAVVALGEIGARATDALILVTGRKDPDVRQLAITFIGVSSGQDKKVVPVLCRCLTDKKQSVREAAAESLFDRGAPGRAVLHKNSRSKVLSVRRGSYRGVSVLELNDKKSVAMMIRGLNDKDSVICRNPSRSSRIDKTRSSLNDLNHWAQDISPGPSWISVTKYSSEKRG